MLAALLLALSIPAARAGGDDARMRGPRQPEVPSPACDRIRAPENTRVLMHVYAVGFQVYRWTGIAWEFVAPDAVLFADACLRREVGTHFAGPTWAFRDGGQVLGSRLDGCSPYPGAIPWLLLSADPLTDEGRVTHATHIQRLNTIGGAAPTTPGTAIGDVARVPYSAEYYFFGGKSKANEVCPDDDDEN